MIQGLLIGKLLVGGPDVRQHWWLMGTGTPERSGTVAGRLTHSLASSWSARKAAVVVKFSSVGGRFNIALVALRVMSSEPKWAERKPGAEERFGRGHGVLLKRFPVSASPYGHVCAHGGPHSTSTDGRR